MKLIYRLFKPARPEEQTTSASRRIVPEGAAGCDAKCWPWSGDHPSRRPKGLLRTSGLCLLFISLINLVSAREPIIVLDPAGHARKLGRLLVEGYERAETLKFAQELKKSLEKAYRVRTVISRSPGEEILPLQVPSFSNRLGADFFLRIHMVRQDQEKPQLFLYNLVFNRFVDMSPYRSDPLKLVPLYQSHFLSAHISKQYGKKLFEKLGSHKKHFDVHNLVGLPLKNLVGVTAPSVLLEIGICREDKWRSLVEPVAKALKFLEG